MSTIKPPLSEKIIQKKRTRCVEAQYVRVCDMLFLCQLLGGGLYFSNYTGNPF